MREVLRRLLYPEIPMTGSATTMIRTFTNGDTPRYLLQYLVLVNQDARVPVEDHREPQQPMSPAPPLSDCPRLING